MATRNVRVGILFKSAPFLVLGICMIVTLLFWNVVRSKARGDLQNEFDAQVRLVHSRIDERLDNYRDILKGAAGLFAASESVERGEFRTYVNTLDLEREYPGIQGVGFSLLISPRDKARRVAAVRKEGFPKFSINPPGVRDPYTAIIYLEPFDWRNQRAFGYDMYSEPVRRAAMERSRDEDTAALSGKVLLVQETGKGVQSGFLLYMPVYRNGMPHGSLQQRRNNLLGWVYEPFRMNDLMTKGVLGHYLDTIKGQLDIEIYDDDTLNEQNRMFDSTISADVGRPQFVSTDTVQHFGRNWTIVVRSLPEFEETLQTGPERMVLFGGSVISMLLTLIVWLLATTNVRAFRLASKMSEKLEGTLSQTINAMATVIEMRDPYTAGHQRRAAELARAIGTEMKLRHEQIQALSLAAMIYEIGKIQVPAEILSKPGRLDAVEYRLIKVHPQAGFEILSAIDFPWPIAKIVQQHHERMDGSGYPLGLKGDEIMLEARIIAVADVVEAMFSHRPYRSALGIEAALAEITAQRGTLYDPAVVDACLSVFREHGFSFAS